MSDNTNPLTPLQRAPKWFSSLRQRRRRLSGQDRFRYYFSRLYRNYVKKWESGGKERFIEDRQKSIDEHADYISTWNQFIVWMENNVRPNEERFQQVRGSGVDATSTRGVGTVKNREVYEGDLRAYEFFLGKISGRVEEVRDELDMAILDGDWLGNLVDEIHAAGYDLGLEPHPQWTDADDGAVWFINSETQNTYFVALTTFSEMADVSYSFRARQRANPRWVDFGLVDLTNTALDIIKPISLSDPTRCFRDYFGLFDGTLRPYMEAADEEPPVGWE